MGSIITNLTKGLDILKYLNPFDENFILKGVIENIGNILKYINPFSDDFILKGVIGILGNMLNYINPFSDDFILKGVLSVIGEIASYLNPFSEKFFVYKLIEMLRDLLKNLFIPNENSFLSIKELVDSKLGFVESIKIGWNSIKNMLDGLTGAPKLTYDVDTKIYKGTITVLDLSFYKPYKPYGDLVFTGFAYVLFIYRLYVGLPNILKANVGASVGQASDIEAYTRFGFGRESGRKR